MLLRKFPAADTLVTGYTDSVAPEAYNVKLSQQRADSVRDALINDHGIDPSRLTAIGYGEDSPVADNKTAAGRTKNRRVELIMDIDAADAYTQETIEGVSFESLDTGLDGFKSVNEPVVSEIAEESMDEIVEKQSQIEEITFEDVDEQTPVLDSVEPEPLSAAEMSDSAAEIKFEYLEE